MTRGTYGYILWVKVEGGEMKNQNQTGETMENTYEIKRGEQYRQDATDVVTVHRTNRRRNRWSVQRISNGQIRYSSGDMLVGHGETLPDEVAEAILATIADGQRRTVIVGEDKPRPAPKPTPKDTGIPGVTTPCPHCGGYCHGDCRA